MLLVFTNPPVVLLLVLMSRLQEKALKSAIHGMEGTLTVTKEALLEPAASAGDQPAGSSPAHSAEQHSQDSMRSNNASANPSAHSRNSDPLGWPVDSAQHTSTTSSLAPAPVPYKDSQILLQRLEQQEKQVQDTLQYLGCEAASYTHMYSTQLLHKALADPGRVAAHLTMSKTDRLNYVAEVGTWTFVSTVLFC